MSRRISLKIVGKPEVSDQFSGSRLRLYDGPDSKATHQAVWAGTFYVCFSAHRAGSASVSTRCFGIRFSK